MFYLEIQPYKPPDFHNPLPLQLLINNYYVLTVEKHWKCTSVASQTRSTCCDLDCKQWLTPEGKHFAGPEAGRKGGSTGFPRYTAGLSDHVVVVPARYQKKAARTQRDRDKSVLRNMVTRTGQTHRRIIPQKWWRRPQNALRFLFPIALV